MSHPISFDYSYTKPFLQEHELEQLEPAIQLAHQMLHQKAGVGANFLGWVDLPMKYDKEEWSRIHKATAKIQADSDALIVIGIGGSYLGARAAIEMLSHSFYNQLSKKNRKTPEIYFVGHHMSSQYIVHLLELLAEKDFSINVISKSGTTTEPAIAFRIFRTYMEQRYGREEARHRIYATTDRAKGALRELADEKGYETFVIPDDVGGRYSVLTSVGLLPIAVAGIDIESMMAGAQEAAERYRISHFADNSSYQYAAVRNILYRKGKIIEVFANYDPAFHYFSEWWKQLFGESEGKDHKGIFPASVNFTTDLHSMGQYIQGGLRNIFETSLFVERSNEHIFLKPETLDLDDLNYLAHKDLQWIHRKAFEGIVLAHTEGGIPNLVIEVKELTPFIFGQLVYFFEKACAISGYLLGVNPFDQPGVEEYKKNMFALLGKTGFELERERLLQRLRNGRRID